MDRKRRDFLSATAAAVTLTAGLPAKLAHAAEASSHASATATATAAQQAQPPASAAAAYAAPSEIKAIDFINLRELEPAALEM